MIQKNALHNREIGYSKRFGKKFKFNMKVKKMHS